MVKTSVDFSKLSILIVENHSLKPYRQRVLGTYVLLEESFRALETHWASLQDAVHTDCATQRDSLPVSWDSVELRLDEECFSRADLLRLGLNRGDFVAIDAQPEITPSGFINSRHLDDKAGAAVLLGAIKAVSAASLSLRGDGTHLVPLDACIETMRQTGADMMEKYKETSLGGLAVNIPNC